MQIFLSLLFILLGFVLLIKGADFLVDGASSLAKKMRISEIAIGLTIVAMGTSAPELVVNLISSTGGHDSVIFGNIIGSNIFNLFLILGITGFIYPIHVQTDTVWIEIPFSLIVTVIFFGLVNDQLLENGVINQTGLIDGLIFLSLFVLFLVYVFFNLKSSDLQEIDDISIYPNWKSILFIAGGSLGLAFGGNLVVDNAIVFARYFNMSEKLIGLTIISAGTSLPELATSAVAAFKRKSDLAVGNILGSNIFNILLVLGVNSIVRPITYDSVLNFDIYILITGTIFLFVFMFTVKQKRLDRWESLILLVGFVLYMIFLFSRK